MCIRIIIISVAFVLTGCVTKKSQDDEGKEVDENAQESNENQESDEDQDVSQNHDESKTSTASEAPANQKASSVTNDGQEVADENNFEALMKSMASQIPAPVARAPAPAPAAAPTVAPSAPAKAAPGPGGGSISVQGSSSTLTARAGKTTKVPKPIIRPRKTPKWIPKKAESSNTEQVENSANSEKRLKSNVLAVREGPSLNSRVVDYLYGGVTVRVLSTSRDGWSQIGVNRFVRSKYLTAGRPKVVGEGRDTYAVKSKALYIRNAPRSDATIVGVLTIGDKLRGSPSQSGWVQIGPKMFVNKAHLDAVGH